MLGSSSPIMHPRLLAALRRFYPSNVSIQQYTATQDSYGAEEPKGWSNVAGLVNLPCSISAVSGREVKRSTGIVAVSPWRIAIAGSYPTITPKMQAVSGGKTYDILVVHHDSQAQTTSLDVEIVT